MPDEKAVRPSSALSDPDAAAQISESDVDAAVAQWRRDATTLKQLLDAEPDPSDDVERI